jgi:uncharacterized protein (UPF0335 family)
MATTEYQPRRAQPGQAFTYTDAEGRQADFRADDEGVVEPKNANEEALLDGFDLPVARKVVAERKTDQKEGEK